MESPFRHKRIAALFVLLLVLLLGFSTWVVTSPEFRDARGRTLITRFYDAARARLTQVGSIVTGRKHQKTKNGKDSGKKAEPTGPASVLVMDNRGRPIKDVTVVFKSDRGKSVSQKTSGSGRVQAQLPLGVYSVAFSHSKYSSDVRRDQRVADAGKGFSLAVTLESRVKLKGTVVTEEGKPVPGASVSGQRNWLQQFSETGGVFLDDAAYPTVVTDGKGVFTYGDVSIGDNTFDATMPGYAPASMRMEIPAGGLTKELKLVLKRPSEISGRVIDESTKPVPGVKVTAVSYQPYGGVASPLPPTGFTASTNNAGQFRLPKLYNNGYYLLRFENSSYATMELANITAGTKGLQLIMQRGGQISGSVAYLDRLTTPARVLIEANAVVNGTSITRTVMSRANGDYAFERLPYGAYQLSVDYNNLINEPRARVASVKDKPSTGNLIEVYEPAMLNGTVLDAFSGDAIADADVTVKASYGFTRTRVRQFQARAGTNGTFTFDKLPGGIHQVTAKAPDYLPTTGKPEDITVPLEPGSRTDDYEVFLSKGGIITGQVVNQDGQGIGDSEVQLYVASGSFNGLNVKDMAATTDGSGFFEFRGFPVGQSLTLYVSARQDGYAKNHSELIELTPQQPEMNTQVMLSPGGVISGQVTDTEGNPLYGVKITFDSREFPGDPSPTEFYTYSDGNGNYLLERCTPGRGVLISDHDKFVRQTRSVNVLEGRLLSRQNFKLQVAHAISGVVADYRGNPIADARVVAAPLPKTLGNGSARTDKKGEFRIEGLGQGSFRLDASFNLTTPDGPQAYTFTVPEVPSDAVGVPIDCDIAPTAVAKVLGERGKGIDDFTVTLRSRLDTNPKQLFRFTLQRKYKNAGGFFRLMKVPRGLYTLKVEAPGYETWESKEVTIGPGNRTNLPSIRMKPASQITGTVVSATTGRRVQGALVRILDESIEETKVVNRIELQAYDRTDILERLDAAYDDDYKYDPDPNSRLVARVRANVVTTRETNVYGKFDVNDLGSGNYTLEIEHPLYRPQRLRNIKVTRDKGTDLGEVELQPGGTIRGRVIDLEGNGIPNAAVQVRGEIQGRSKDHTDVGGNFVLRGIGNGEWTVSVIATLNGRKVFAWKRVSVRPDENTTVEFVLETSANVNGRVRLNGGAVPKTGVVRLYYVDDTGTVLDDIVYSDSLNNGNYSISNIPPGRYFAVCSGQGPRGPFGFYTWVELNRGRNNTPLEITNASLAGVTYNVSGGAPAAGSTVQLSLDAAGVIVPGSIQNLLKVSDRTDGSGRFVLPYLQPGTYRIWAAGAGAQLIPVDAVSVGPGQAVTGYRVNVQVLQ